MIKAAQDPRWLRIQAYPLEVLGGALSFLVRLARENGWSTRTAQRAIVEYRRFCYLATGDGSTATPSAMVDQVWHLHLTYSRDYWDRFCPQILGMPLHHDPSAGGREEAERHDQQYVQTLLRYVDVFDEQPPEDLWPAARENFAAARSCRWIDQRHYWLVPRPRLTARLWTLAGLTATSHAGAQDLNPLELNGVEFLWMFAALLLAALILRWWLGRRMRARPRVAAGIRPDPYQLAMLAGGEPRVMDVATTAMLEHGAIEVVNRQIRKKAKEYRGDPIQTAIWNAAGPDLAPNALVRTAVTPLREVRQGLVSSGLQLDAAQMWQLRFWRLLPLMLLFALGVTKLGVGLARDRPIALLVLLLIVVLMFVVGTLFDRDRNTLAGRRLLREHQRQHQLLRRACEPTTQGLAVALFGAAVLTSPAVVAYQQLRQPGSDGSSGSSGCSGGNTSNTGGSGCGGCGGGGGD